MIKTKEYCELYKRKITEVKEQGILCLDYKSNSNYKVSTRILNEFIKIEKELLTLLEEELKNIAVIEDAPHKIKNIQHYPELKKVKDRYQM